MSDILQYKCPCCGGAIAFDPNTQKVKCPYCGNEYEMETLKSYDESLKTSPDEMKWKNSATQKMDNETADGMASYHCDSCGAEIITDKETAASSCPYCGNPIVMTENLKGLLQPDFVIPFKLDKKAAKAALLKHCQGRPLLPKVFTNQNHIDEIRGIYVPFWLFDCDADANMTFKAERVRHHSDSNNDYTETSYYLIKRAGSIGFDKVPVDGSTKMDDTLMEAIEPFDYDDAMDFQTAYLAGYLADRYDVDADASIPRANQRIKTSTEMTFASTVIGYEAVIPQSSRIIMNSGEVHYALLPVWLLNTSWHDKKYVFAMNGQTGKFIGDLPVDGGLRFRYYLLFWLISAAIVFVIMLLVGIM